MAPGHLQHFGDQPGNQQRNKSNEDRFLHSRLHLKRPFENRSTRMQHLRLNDVLSDSATRRDFQQERTGSGSSLIITDLSDGS
jgi:hypothetical protein